MKKMLFLALAATFAIVSCKKDEVEKEQSTSFEKSDMEGDWFELHSVFYYEQNGTVYNNHDTINTGLYVTFEADGDYYGYSDPQRQNVSGYAKWRFNVGENSFWIIDVNGTGDSVLMDIVSLSGSNFHYENKNDISAGGQSFVTQTQYFLEK